MAPPPFKIKDCALIGLATGRRASTLREMAEHLAAVGTDCIYNHFWGRMLQPRFEEPEYDNDFAAWAGRALHDATLAERLGVVTPTDTPDMETLREEVLEILAERLDESEALPWTRAAFPFDFLRSQIVVFDTHKRMLRPEDMAAEISHLSAGSVFYHFIDARRRLPDGGDDFCLWLGSWGPRYAELAARIGAIDPYFSTLRDLHREIADIVHSDAEARR